MYTHDLHFGAHSKMPSLLSLLAAKRRSTPTHPPAQELGTIYPSGSQWFLDCGSYPPKPTKKILGKVAPFWSAMEAQHAAWRHPDHESGAGRQLVGSMVLHGSQVPLHWNLIPDDSCLWGFKTPYPCQRCPAMHGRRPPDRSRPHPGHQFHWWKAW